jgi:hypothetical protein
MFDAGDATSPRDAASTGPLFSHHGYALKGVEKIFGEAAGHSRMIYTNPEMPLDSPVLIVFMAEVEG